MQTEISSEETSKKINDIMIPQIDIKETKSSRRATSPIPIPSPGPKISARKRLNSYGEPITTHYPPFLSSPNSRIITEASFTEQTSEEVYHTCTHNGIK